MLYWMHLRKRKRSSPSQRQRASLRRKPNFPPRSRRKNSLTTAPKKNQRSRSQNRSRLIGYYYHNANSPASLNSRTVRLKLVLQAAKQSQRALRIVLLVCLSYSQASLRACLEKRPKIWPSVMEGKSVRCGAITDVQSNHWWPFRQDQLRRCW